MISRRPNDPRSWRGQASILGIVALFVLIVLSASIVAAVGTAAISQSKQQSADQQAVREMQSLQTKIGEIATSQARGSFDGASSQEMAVRPDRGWIRVTQHDYDGAGSTEVIANESLGEVVYERGETTLAYQAGGLWQLESDGSSQMVAKPAIEYRDATMTVPMIGVEEGSLDQSSTIAFEKTDERRVFPNQTGSTPGDEIGPPYDGTNDPYTNPMKNGSVSVTVQSRYHEGWANYFRSTTGGEVTHDPGAQTATVTLKTPTQPPGTFDMPLEGDSVPIRGLPDGHSLDTYELTLEPAKSHLKNTHWSMYVDNGTEHFELHFFANAKKGACGGGAYNGELIMTAYYANATTHEEWRTKQIVLGKTDDFEVNCPDLTLDVNVMTDEPMMYKDIDTMPGVSNAKNKFYFGPEIKNNDISSETTSLEYHEVDPGQKHEGEKVPAGVLMAHYFDLLGPEFNLTVTDGPGGSERINESRSSGRIRFPALEGPQYLQYFHVTDRDVVVDVRE